MVKRIRTFVSILLALLLVLSSAAALAQSDQQITLRYSYWGSSYENDAMQEIAAKYHELHPNITIDCIYIPNADYTTKMTAMLASGDEPDIAYLFASDFINWGKDGRFLNLYDMLDQDPNYSTDDFIPYSFYEVAPGNAGARGICNEVMMLYYNIDLFDELGVEHLPAKPEEALTWDQFVNLCQRLTIDANGNNALSSDFDPNQISVYGFDFAKSSTIWSAFVIQNGGSFLNEDGTAFNMTDPKTVDALQKLSDLINVYHVTPDPLTSSNANMSVTAALQSKKVAIICDGSWTNLDMSSIGINYDVGCLPNMSGTPCLMAAYSAMGIFNTTQHPQEAYDFLMFLADPSSASELYSSGLWMPIMKAWYQDTDLLAQWTDPETTGHTPGFYDAAVNYSSYSYQLAAEIHIINWTKMDAVIESALDSVWLGDTTAQDAMTEITPVVNNMVEGYISFK